MCVSWGGDGHRKKGRENLWEVPRIGDKIVPPLFFVPEKKAIVKIGNRGHIVPGVL